MKFSVVIWSEFNYFIFSLIVNFYKSSYILGAMHT